MKKAGLALGMIAGIILFIFSCDKLKSDHPQAGLEAIAEKQLDEHGIQAYADSVNLLLPELEKRQSLVYTLGDYSFSIVKYMDNGRPVLYIEEGVGDESAGTIKKYYLKNDKLILYTEESQVYNTSAPYKSKRLYFRNNILFYAEQKTAQDSTELKKVSYDKINAGDSEPYANIFTMEDALNQQGKFDLVFDGITEYPRARYLVLSKNEINAYRAVIKVDKEDDLIRELASNPSRYTGARLDIKWNINGDNEAVYKAGSLKRN